MWRMCRWNGQNALVSKFLVALINTKLNVNSVAFSNNWNNSSGPCVRYTHVHEEVDDVNFYNMLSLSFNRCGLLSDS